MSGNQTQRRSQRFMGVFRNLVPKSPSKSRQTRPSETAIVDQTPPELIRSSDSSSSQKSLGFRTALSPAIDFRAEKPGNDSSVIPLQQAAAPQLSSSTTSRL